MPDSSLTSSPPLPPGNLPVKTRQFAWNDDYIELLAHKLDLQTVKTLVDLGSGLGGLPGLFGLYMKPGSTVYGFDLDPEAVREAQAFAAANPYSVRFEFAVADAYQLPLADGAADLVVCQHVLARVGDPAKALKELCRVVRPGGRVVAFEPSRRVQSLVNDSVEEAMTLDEHLAAVRYEYFYEAGRRARGEGDDSVGDRLPTLFQAAGLHHLEVRLSDKSAALVPPYDSPEKQARVAELLDWPRQHQANQDYIRTCFLAGGGTLEELESFTRWELQQFERVKSALEAGTFTHPGGMLTYIVIGQKH